MISNQITQSNNGLGQTGNSIVTSAKAPVSSSGASASANITTGLEKGQVVRGEVIDLRSNEVSIRLEDGRLLNGTLENSASLSIGEKVNFRVEDVSVKNLVLKIVAEGQYTLPDTTIDKALEAAGLSKNSRNRSIVQELLNQHMSIDKKTISTIIQQSLGNKSASLNTLVLMNKYRIPITESNISQLEAYRNGDFDMMKEIGQLTDSISDFFARISDTSESTISQGSDLLKLILQSNKENATASVNSDSGTIQNSAANLGESQNSIVTTGSLLSKDESLTLVNLLSSLPNAESAIPSDLLNSLKDGTANLRETAHVLQQIINSAHTDSQSEKDAMVQSSMIDTPFSQSSSASTLENSPICQSLLSAYQELQYNNNEIGAFLPEFQRMQLLKSLEEFHLSSDIKSQIESGDISTHDLLSFLQEKLDSVPDAVKKELFTSKEYQTLMKEELTAKWSFTPDSLTKEKQIEKHFESLSREINDLMNFMEKASGDKNGAVSQQANHLQENMDFMKALNQMFTYVQLPLRLKNQNVHSELYVYTRKKGGGSAKEGVSVLLHLDMEHLGPLDIHLDLHHKNVVGKFYLNQEDSINLISSQLPQLIEALKNNGYELNAEIIKRTEEVNVVEDFMEEDTSIPSVTRYNFDIRA